MAESQEKGKLKILVVDDDSTTRKVLKNHLQTLGYMAKTADDGQQALEMITKEPFDLLLVDIMMPEMDGFAFIRIFQNALKSQIPTIMMSGTDDATTIRRVFEVGAEDFLQKPIQITILEERIKGCLKQRKLNTKTNMLNQLVEEEIKSISSLEEKMEEKEKQYAKYKKEVENTIETPMQVVIKLIKEVISQKYDKNQLKIALISILKSLGGSDLHKPAFLHYLEKSTNLDEATRKWLIDQYTTTSSTPQAEKQEFPSQIPTKQEELLNIEKNVKEDDDQSILNRYLNVVKNVDIDTLDFNMLSFTLVEVKSIIVKCFYKLDLFNKMKISMKRFSYFLDLVEKQYILDNFYHTFYHAGDIVQFLYHLCSQEEVRQRLSDMDIFSLMISALCHDVGHPGYNNNFLVGTENNLALVYNDISVLENYHSATTFKNILETRLLDHFTDPEYRDFRKKSIAAILATDMAFHFPICSMAAARLKTSGSLLCPPGSQPPAQPTPQPAPAASQNPNDKLNQEEEDKLLILKVLMKCADISNCVRPIKIAKVWGKTVLNEFLTQGDKERDQGLPVSPLMDRYNLNFPKTQMDFIDFLAKPLFKHLIAMYPNFTVKINDQMNHNRDYWEKKMGEFAAKSEKERKPFVPPPTAGERNQNILKKREEEKVKALQKKPEKKKPENWFVKNWIVGVVLIILLSLIIFRILSSRKK